MEGFVDHYIVLGLPSGEEALKHSDKEIWKAYKSKALVWHPDKRPDDPDAHEKFQRVKTSYEVLRDKTARKLFDDLLRVQRERREKKSQVDSKRRKMMSDLEERERRSGLDPSHAARGYDDEEEGIGRRLKEELERIRARHARKRGGFEIPESGGVDGKRREDGIEAGAGVQLDKERVLRVSWKRIGEGYTVRRIREVFEKFGGVDVVISTKKKCSALIEMATKDEAVAATRTFSGDLSNPLRVVPLQSALTDFVTANKSAEAEPQSNIVGIGYQAYENDVMERLRKVFST